MQSSEKIVVISKHSPWGRRFSALCSSQFSKCPVDPSLHKALNLLLRWGHVGSRGYGKITAIKSIWSLIEGAFKRWCV